MEEKTYGITDIGTFLMDHDGEIFRIWVYRKAPYEVREGFYVSPYEEDLAQLVRITNAIEIPGDVLLETVNFDDEYDKKKNYSYYRLSEIRLARYEGDKDEDFVL